MKNDELLLRIMKKVSIYIVPTSFLNFGLLTFLKYTNKKMI